MTNVIPFEVFQRKSLQKKVIIFHERLLQHILIHLDFLDKNPRAFKSHVYSLEEHLDSLRHFYKSQVSYFEASQTACNQSLEGFLDLIILDIQLLKEEWTFFSDNLIK